MNCDTKSIEDDVIFYVTDKYLEYHTEEEDEFECKKKVNTAENRKKQKESGYSIKPFLFNRMNLPKGRFKGDR